MQKWEYLFVTSKAAKNVLRPYYINGKPMKDWENNMPIYDYITKLGEQGWELVSITQSLVDQTYNFKRPKE